VVLYNNSGRNKEGFHFARLHVCVVKYGGQTIDNYGDKALNKG